MVTIVRTLLDNSGNCFVECLYLRLRRTIFGVDDLGNDDSRILIS